MHRGATSWDAVRGRATGGAARARQAVALHALSLPLATRLRSSWFGFRFRFLISGSANQNASRCSTAKISAFSIRLGWNGNECIYVGICLCAKHQSSTVVRAAASMSHDMKRAICLGAAAAGVYWAVTTGKDDIKRGFVHTLKVRQSTSMSDMTPLHRRPIAVCFHGQLSSCAACWVGRRGRAHSNRACLKSALPPTVVMISFLHVFGMCEASSAWSLV